MTYLVFIGQYIVCIFLLILKLGRLSIKMHFRLTRVRVCDVCNSTEEVEVCNHQ